MYAYLSVFSLCAFLCLCQCLCLSLLSSPHLFLSLSLPVSIGPEMGDKIYQEATELEEKLKKEDEEANPEAYVLCFLCSPCLLLPLACACHPQLWLWN